MTRTPLHRSLVARLLALSLLVMVCAVAATAWLAVKSTRQAIQREQGHGLSYDSRIYDEVIGYAATHTTWPGVRPLLIQLAAITSRQITLTGENGTVLASSQAPPPVLPARRSALVDPLYLEGYLSADQADESGIDRRAVGPYRLTGAERGTVSAKVLAAQACMTGKGVDTVVDSDTAGRPKLMPPVAGSDAAVAQLADCYRRSGADVPTPTERKALEQLTKLTNACLGSGRPPVTVRLGFTWSAPGEAGEPQDCVDAARREQLRPYVAPPAYLYINDPPSASGPVFDLSRANALRITGVSVLVLVVAFAITLLVGLRMSRPLRALIRAAEHGTGRLPVRGRDEIGRLTAAFNELAERREAVERQRQAMVSDIAHELGTPLTTIRAWVQAARDGVTDAGPPLLDLLADEAELLQHVIDDLRDLAAADAGRLRLHPEPVFLNELLDQAVAAHRSDAEGVTIITDLSGDPEVILDPVRVRQAVGNLLSNAVRHSPAGAIVTVRSHADGDHVVIEVADAGSGIEEADLPHVFERFWRADRSRSRHTGGSGLGLAIVRNLVEAHGGTVSATSRPGHGSTFTIRLPAVA